MGLPINIDELIKKNTVESERIEFKKGWNPEDVMHSMCAFANDIHNWGGGYIIIGIEEKEGLPILPPIGLELNQIDSIQKKIIQISNKILPNYSPIISPEIYLGKNILVIYAPGGDARPYKAPKNWDDEKVYWVRKSSNSLVANSIDEKHLIELANKIPFDDRINNQASIKDLSLQLIQGFLREVDSQLYSQSATIPFVDLCRQLNIVRGSIEGIRPVNAGLLLFCETPEKFFKGSLIEVIVYKDDVGDKFEESKFIGPLQLQIKNVLNFIKSNIIKEKIVKVPNQAESIRTQNYPYEAIEEAIANAIYHKSYELLNSIKINIRLDCIEILSFPGPLPPLNNLELQKTRVVARDYRNRRIGDFLKELKFTEGRGTGFPKIRKSMELNGSPKPIFETDKELTYFLTILPINSQFLN